MTPELHDKYQQRVLDSLKKRLGASYRDIQLARHEDWRKLHDILERRIHSIHHQIWVVVILISIFGFTFGMDHFERYFETRETQPLIFSISYVVFMVTVSSAWVFPGCGSSRS